MSMYLFVVLGHTVVVVTFALLHVIFSEMSKCIIYLLYGLFFFGKYLIDYVTLSLRGYILNESRISHKECCQLYWFSGFWRGGYDKVSMY